MSLSEIEAQLDQLCPDELRRVVLNSWRTFGEKERVTGGINECEEDDPQLLVALDGAIAQADTTPGQGHLGRDVRAGMNE